jgi:hypothetical protein
VISRTSSGKAIRDIVVPTRDRLPPPHRRR